MWDDDEDDTKLASPMHMIIGVGVLVGMALMFALAGDVAARLVSHVLH